MGNKCSNDETDTAGSHLAASDKEGKSFPSPLTFPVCLIFNNGGVHEKCILNHVKAGKIQFATNR